MFNFEIIDCEQGSEEWFNARLGVVTASQYDGVTTLTGKRSATTEKIINKKVAEYIVGQKEDEFKSKAMERGNDCEDEALDFFNLAYGYGFKKVGFIRSLTGGFGCSPDAIDFDNKIGLELKCPLAHTHIKYLSENKLPKIYYQQIQGSMMVTGFDKWIFGSYHPEITGLHLVINRDDEFIEKLRNDTQYCVEQIQERYKRIIEIASA